MDAFAAQLDVARAALAAVARVDRSMLNDIELTQLVRAEEAVARLISASQVQSAAEVDERSRHELGRDGLSARNSFARPVPFLEYLTGASQKDLAGRVRLGRAIRDRVSFFDEPLPASLPFLAEAVKGGIISTDAAAVIEFHLRQASTGLRATAERTQAAEIALTELAAEHPVDFVAENARVWRDALDPDGAEPRYDEIVARRGLTKGRERNGITPWRFMTDPRATALLDAVLDEATAPGAVPRFREQSGLGDGSRPFGLDTIVDSNGVDVEILNDPRTRSQLQHDVVIGVLTAGLRASHDVAPDLRTTGTVMATITLAELESGRGLGYLNGSEEPIPAKVVQQLVCDAGVRLLVLGKNGKPLFEASRNRYFTDAHRRAMMVRDGDHCVGPGCRAPAAWTDAHHVEYWSRGGPTGVDNGVLLCGSCHTGTHAGEFELQMRDGIPHFRLGIHGYDPTAWRRAGRQRVRWHAA